MAKREIRILSGAAYDAIRYDVGTIFDVGESGTAPLINNPPMGAQP
jgi:hypothetical protein